MTLLELLADVIFGCACAFELRMGKYNHEARGGQAAISSRATVTLARFVNVYLRTRPKPLRLCEVYWMVGACTVPRVHTTHLIRRERKLRPKGRASSGVCRSRS